MAIDKNENGILDSVESKIESDKASVRKQLARRCFIFPVVLTFAVLLLVTVFPEVVERIDTISEIIITAIGMSFSVVGAYVGVTSWAEVKFKQRP